MTPNSVISYEISLGFLMITSAAWTMSSASWIHAVMFPPFGAAAACLVIPQSDSMVGAWAAMAYNSVTTAVQFLASTSAIKAFKSGIKPMISSAHLT